MHTGNILTRCDNFIILRLIRNSLVCTKFNL